MEPPPPSYDEAMSEKVPNKTAAASATVEETQREEDQPQEPLNSSSDEDLCPVCRRGHLQKSYSCLGVCLAIALFPCGILCCLRLTDRVCDNAECGATY